MIELEEASQRILDVIHPTGEEIVALSEIDGRVLAEDLTAPINLPTFDNSAMDGYAVRAAEALTGGRLQCIGEAPAGSWEGEWIPLTVEFRLLVGSGGATEEGVRERRGDAPPRPETARLVWLLGIGEGRL